MLRGGPASAAPATRALSAPMRRAGRVAHSRPGSGRRPLIELASVSIHDRALFLGSGAVDKDILRKVNSAAVQMFLAYYGGAKTAYAMAAE
nr:TetR/AcrR family transcriptional regulator C-terminal domain-containing protein [Paracoccus mutanolyticus]